MIYRRFSSIEGAWHGLIDELAYRPEKTGALGKGGITTSFPDLVVVEIADVLGLPQPLHLGWSGYTKTRWTQFLKRYFRSDLASWIDDTALELSGLNKHQVASYSVSYNPPRKKAGRDGYGHSAGGHRHGACLASLQLQNYPEPKVIVVSRASMIEKAGFLDLSLMYLVAKRTGWERPIKGVWVMSMGFIAAVAQIYHCARFKKKLKGHSLEVSTRRFTVPEEDAKYGPQRSSIRRVANFRKYGEIPRSRFVDDLSLEF